MNEREREREREGGGSKEGRIKERNFKRAKKEKQLKN